MSWQFFLMILDQVAVLVPGFVEELHEAHAALDQPAGQQAVVGERRLARLGAVHLEHVLRLLRDVHQLRRAGLHAERHLERVDARGDFGIADCVEPHLVQLLDRIERVALQLVVDAARVREIQHRVAAAAELHALIDRRQKAAAPAASCRRWALCCRC